jgi:transcriptional adapter 3
MSSILSPYPSSPPLLSPLIKDPPDAIPPIDDLEALQAELKLLQQKAYERAKKAGNDLKTIEESMRRMKEKEKGKARAVEKARKDRACACFCVRVRIPILLDVNVACHYLTRHSQREWR